MYNSGFAICIFVREQFMNIVCWFVCVFFILFLLISLSMSSVHATLYVREQFMGVREQLLLIWSLILFYFQ